MCRSVDAFFLRQMNITGKLIHPRVFKTSLRVTGLKLPYSYQLEMLLLHHNRMQDVKRLKASFKTWAVAKPQASLDGAQYTESRIVAIEEWPEYPRILSNVQAKALQEVGLEIISMVSYDYDMCYVCMCQDQMTLYLLSLRKIPKVLKQQATDYRLWHMDKFNCVPENFDDRAERAALPVITRHPNKLFGKGLAGEIK